MISILKKVAKKIVFGKSRTGVIYSGNYSKWEDAESLCEGYDSLEIFQKVCNSTLAVRDGKAAYERDSVLFYKKDFNRPLLMWLILEASKHENSLRILDFGGALGSTYFQNIDLFREASISIRWYILDQKHFVEFGQKELQNDELVFVNEISEIQEKIDAVLFSSVLQYLKDYKCIIKNILHEIKPECLFIERNPVGVKERIWIETVTEPIYNATYPCRVFEEKKFLEDIFSEYVLVDTWHSLVDGDVVIDDEVVAEFKTFVLKRRTN